MESKTDNTSSPAPIYHKIQGVFFANDIFVINFYLHFQTRISGKMVVNRLIIVKNGNVIN